MTARSLPLVAIALLALVLVINVRVVAGGRTWADAHYHTEVAPPRLAAGEDVRSLRVPAWFEGTSFGVPLLAEPSHGALVPALWLASSPRSLDWLQLVHLAWCALGVAVWARRRSAGTRASDPSALVAGLLVVTTGVLASALVRGALPGIAHLPWIGACAAQLADARSTRERARLSALLGALLGVVALSGVLAAFVDGVILAVALAARAPTTGSAGTRGSALRWLAGALVAGCAIGAAQWLPAALHLPHAAGATVHGLPLARLLELVVPGSFGAADPARGVHALAGDHAWAPSLFVGAPLVALAAIRIPPRRILGVIGALVVLALVAGRGGWPAWLGAPELHVAALAIVLAAHAGAGLDAVLAGTPRALRSLSAALGCSLLALVALGILRVKQPETEAAIDRALVEGGLGLVCLAGALVLARQRPRDDAERPAWHAPLILALIVLPAAGAQGSIAPLADRDIVAREPAYAIALADTARAIAPAPVRVFRPAFMHDTYADLEEDMATLAGASPGRWHLAGARSESPARSALHDRVWLAAYQEGGALLDRFAIGAAILPATMVDSPRSLFHELARRGSWPLVTLPVAPVASVVRSWLWQRDVGEALALMFSRGGGTSLHRGTIVLAGAGAPGASPLDPSPCTVRGWQPGEIELGCTDAGYAVVTSTAMPGWTATVNGEERPWVAADILRRAVKVDANAAIVWSYRAPGLVAGLLVAALGILVLAAMLVLGRRVREAADDDRDEDGLDDDSDDDSDDTDSDRMN